MKRVYALLALLLVSTSLFAGEDTTGTEKAPEVVKERMIARGKYLSLGGFYGNLDKLDSRVGDLGYPGLKNYAYSLGFGTFWASKRLFHEFEFKGALWRTANGANAATHLANLSATVNIGVNVLPDSKWRLYPYVGAGLGGMFLQLTQETATFDAAVTQHLEKVWLVQRTGALQAGLGADITIPYRGHAKRSRVLGLRAGYMWDPSPGKDWRTADIDVSDGPSVSMSGVYAQIVLGSSKHTPFWPHRKKSGCDRKGECTHQKKEQQ